jgi:predicted transglutaminase-like cysteine proteinase
MVHIRAWLQLKIFSLFSRNFTVFIYLVGILTVWGVSGTLDTATNALLYKKTQNHQASVISTKLGQWQELIQNARHLPEKQKLQLINNFFNQQIAFVDDIDLWGVNDRCQPWRANARAGSPQ